MNRYKKELKKRGLLKKERTLTNKELTRNSLVFSSVLLLIVATVCMVIT